MADTATRIRDLRKGDMVHCVDGGYITLIKWTCIWDNYTGELRGCIATFEKADGSTVSARGSELDLDVLVVDGICACGQPVVDGEYGAWDHEYGEGACEDCIAAAAAEAQRVYYDEIDRVREQEAALAALPSEDPYQRFSEATEDAPPF